MLKAKVYPVGSHPVANSRAMWKQAMVDIGAKDPRVIALCGDLSRSICTDQFKEVFPDRFFNVGIAEQDMVGIAAGLALKGKLPYAVSYATFATMRACEQFRTDCCYQNVNVRLIGCAGGLTGGGATHSGMEDAAIIRSMANSTVCCPSDPAMMAKILDASLTYDGPMYIRLSGGRGEELIYDGDFDYQIGKAIEVREGKDITLIGFGAILTEALKAAEALSQEGIEAQVIDMHTLKPFDTDAVLEAIRGTGRIITVEDHNIIGGLGSATAEAIAESGMACKFKRIGIPDCYAHFGGGAFLHKTYGYDADAIVAAAKTLL